MSGSGEGDGAVRWSLIGTSEDPTPDSRTSKIAVCCSNVH